MEEVNLKIGKNKQKNSKDEDPKQKKSKVVS